MSNYVITGANSEIGTALAKHLITCGHRVLLVSRTPPKKLVKGTDWIDKVDLTNENDLLRLREFVESKFESSFTVIHSVGDFWAHKSITNTAFSEVVSQINSHYVTLFGVMKSLVPVMKKVGGGKIVAFSCNSVKYNYPDMAAFTSAKAAVECLIKCVANEQSKNNIICNAFALPSIKTKNVIETKPEVFHENYPTLDELTECIEKTIENLSTLSNGNIISLFKYSDSFYNKGYYQRNIIWEATKDETIKGIL